MTSELPTPPDRDSPFADETAQYRQVYIDESQEELENLVEAALRLEVNPRDADALHKAFRMLHSLKGSSGMLGFEVVGNFAHELEDRFERYRSGQAVLDRDTTTLVLKCVDYFRAFLDRLRAGEIDEGDPSPLLNQLCDHERSVAESPSAAAPARVTEATPAIHVRSDVQLPTISGGLRVVVHFRQGLQLADLKARLILARLSSVGEIITCDPPIDDIHSFEALPLFSLTLVTDRPVDEVRRIANVDGVESVEIGHQQLTAEALGVPTSGAVLEPAPAPVASEETPASAEPGPEEPQIENADEPAANSGKVASEAVQPRSPGAETLRVEIGRLDNLMNLTGELVVANARFVQLAGNMSGFLRRGAVSQKSTELSDRLRRRFDQLRGSLAGSTLADHSWSQLMRGLDEDLESLERQSELWEVGHRHFADVSQAVDQLSRVSKNLQRGVLNTRMVPVGPLFNRFKRVIRDLSVERNKQVRLVIQGEKTELDKRMIDALGDPLLHLLRNAIDHGLEGPEQRRAAGKPEHGTIVLEAAHRGNNVLITVRDDGGGIARDRIKARVLERGLASEPQVREMTDAQIISYIWHPGFSTAESVSEISGRGVGMDIVRSAISELSGTIDVASNPGEGTTFTIRLPLTLAIIHSLMVRYRGGDFSIPIDDVREIVAFPSSEVYSVHGHTTIDFRGGLIPLISMGAAFSWSARSTSESTDAAPPSSNAAVNVVVLSSRGKTVGLSVDSLVGRADLVIKSLTDNYRPIRGLLGASILGDGSVCLMIDSAALIELAGERVHAGAVG